MVTSEQTKEDIKTSDGFDMGTLHKVKEINNAAVQQRAAVLLEIITVGGVHVFAFRLLDSVAAG